MKRDFPSPFLAVTIIATQLFGPTALWAAEQRGIRIDANRQIIVSALSGDQVTLQGEQGTKALQFREGLAEGARVTTGAGTTAELLIGNRAVVALGNGTTAQVRTISADQMTIHVTAGMVRVAAAASGVGPHGLVTVQTPTSQVQTRGGILRVTVDSPISKAEHKPNGAQAYRASYATGRLLAAAPPASDLIHVEEGTAEIPGIGPTGGQLTVKAGQRVMIQAGRAGVPTEAGSLGAGTTGIPATMSHAQTPKEGRDYLVALQVDQATKLGQRLTGAAETGQKESEKKNDAKNVINGATGGVTLQNSLVSALFGVGGATNPAISKPLETTGNGFGGTNSNASFGSSLIQTSVFRNNPNALLTFTRKDPIELVVKQNQKIEVDGSIFESGAPCHRACLEVNDSQVLNGQPDRVESKLIKPAEALPFLLTSKFGVQKELILIGGKSNQAHGGIAPTDSLIIRGLGRADSLESNVGFVPTDRFPSDNDDANGAPDKIVAANNTFVVDSDKNFSKVVFENIPDGQGGEVEVTRFIGGTLGQYSRDPDIRGISHSGEFIPPDSLVDGAITATTDKDRPTILLKGGVSLDQETIVTIGGTEATNTYFNDLPATFGRKFSGSLLSVIKGTTSTPVSLIMQDRMLGVYDGSTVSGGNPTCTDQNCNRALLSILDAKLKGPGSSIPLIDIASGSHFTVGEEVAPDGKRSGTSTSGSQPKVTVTSALVTRSTLPLDGALLEASAPLFALTQATMTTTSHFADLAGNQAQSLKLGDALVALNASKLIINSGHLLNLNNATAAISGYLFSLTNGSQLDIKNGALFSLSSNSSLTLNGNAFGAFGSSNNTLTIENNLCTGSCGRLVNSARQPITTLEGIPLMVSGVTQDLVLPNGFNAFALAPGATAVNAKIDIDTNYALLHLDPTSTLTINGTKVK